MYPDTLATLWHMYLHSPVKPPLKPLLFVKHRSWTSHAPQVQNVTITGENGTLDGRPAAVESAGLSA